MVDVSNTPPEKEVEPAMTNYNPSHEPALERRLHRSDLDSWLGGVLGGIGETYNINSTLLRVLFVASMLLPGPQILLYLAAWVIMPR